MEKLIFYHTEKIGNDHFTVVCAFSQRALSQIVALVLDSSTASVLFDKGNLGSR